MFTEVSCPNCLTPINLQNHNYSTINCEACNSQFVMEGHLCSKCHSYYKEEVDNCGRCGTAMKRTCGKCHTSNYAWVEYCKSCGVAMDLINVTIQSFHEQSARHKAARLAQMSETRMLEEARSQERMAEMERVEQERKAAILVRRKEQQRRDVYAMMLIGSVGVCILVISLWVIFSA